jgi:EAL domain-containing protein (putative c-di-GMP-specific phosphodiesterase class I)
LLSAADSALFRAKTLGRNQLNVFTPELLASATERFGLEQRLRRAIQRDELALVFQPEVSADTFKVVVEEALLRWRQPDGRLASPGDFLEVAEAAGIIADLDAWVLDKAISTAASWYHGKWKEARVAVNVSPRQVMDSSFTDRLLALLRRHRLPNHCLEIELTESALQTGSAVIDTLRKVRAMGIPVALDDFGTGYSSLTSLEQLPLSRVKIDRSLLLSLGQRDRADAIVQTIVTLCRQLNLEVTAEGIETVQQLDWLLKHKQLCLQGYLLSRPVSAEELPRILETLPQQSVFDVLTGRAVSLSGEEGANEPFVAASKRL